MMRFPMIAVTASVTACLTAFASAAQAWEFTSEPICTVTDATSLTQVKMTFDGSLYTLQLWHPDGWPPGPVFGIRFMPNGPLIQTDRHQIDGNTLTVADTGFGNVMRGMAGNTVAMVILGETLREIDLTEAADPVNDFADCFPERPSA